MATLSEINCTLCTTVQQLWDQRWCGIDCNNDQLLAKAHDYYRYKWMKENTTDSEGNICGSDYTIDCLIATQN